MNENSVLIGVKLGLVKSQSGNCDGLVNARLKHYGKYVRVSKEMKDQRVEGYAMAVLGNAIMRLGDMKKAKWILEQSIRLSQASIG